MSIDRLKAIAAHLRTGKLAHEKFDFSCLNCVPDTVCGVKMAGTGQCGTLGCAMGEFPIIFPNDWTFGTKGYPGLKKESSGVTSTDVAEYLGLGPVEVDHLFYPDQQEPSHFGGKQLGDDATKEDVADNIDAFIVRMSS